LQNHVPATETFPPLTALTGIRHAFSLRTTADTKSDNFQPHLLQSLGFPPGASAEQPHGNQVAHLTHPGIHPGVDALITNLPGLPLVIRCADCAPIFIVDPNARAIALIHSGKKGTQLNITGNTVAAMRASFGANPANCTALVGPCIGPCHYEMDIRSEIERQLSAAGIKEIHSSRICTACHLDRYFSYRAERGQTGRMFAVLALA
jgi:polyphenol oxidase